MRGCPIDLEECRYHARTTHLDYLEECGKEGAEEYEEIIEFLDDYHYDMVNDFEIYVDFSDDDEYSFSEEDSA